MLNQEAIPVYILALNWTRQDVEERLIRLALNLPDNIKVKHLKGCYKGTLENSYLIPASRTTKEQILALAAEYDQECVLFLDESRAATLLYVNDKLRVQESIGKLVQKPRAVALNQGSYTYDPSTDTYFIIK